uniref:Uncharacterized protein n=1 Tax=Tanacetum cinerariifolium TaxID=118510 RepID=A0A6L2NRC5_TANCI|nr:hypothetical protein [Tanacetum cinerariifolium]
MSMSLLLGLFMLANWLLTRGKGNVDASHAIESHGDNEGGLSGLQTRPSPAHHSGTVLRTPCIFIVIYVLQANTLLRFEALKEQHADLAYANESFKDVKARYKECKKEIATNRLEELEEETKEAYQINSSQAHQIKQLEEALKQSEADAHQLRTEKECYVVEAGRGEMVRQRIINQYLFTFVRRLHQSAEYKRLLREVFSLAIGKGFMDGISIGRKDVDIQAILKATSNVDPASSDTFMDAYEKLFDRSV